MRNNQIVKQPSQVIAKATYQGPIPPAAEMERYGQISPDLPQKIIQMAIDEQKHRFELDNADVARRKAELDINAKLVSKGIGASIFCITIIMAAAVLCAYFRCPIASGIVGGGGIVVIVSVFVCGSKVKSAKNN